MHFFAAGGQTPPPLAEFSAKNASFFDELPMSTALGAFLKAPKLTCTRDGVHRKTRAKIYQTQFENFEKK